MEGLFLRMLGFWKLGAIDEKELVKGGFVGVNVGVGIGLLFELTNLSLVLFTGSQHARDELG